MARDYIKYNVEGLGGKPEQNHTSVTRYLGKIEMKNTWLDYKAGMVNINNPICSVSQKNGRPIDYITKTRKERLIVCFELGRTIRQLMLPKRRCCFLKRIK